MPVAIPLLPPPPPSGGGVPPGSPNSIAYYDPLGVTITTDANLTAFPTDAFGRPQIWDKRFTARGAIWRQGAWQIDGDPVSVKSEGIVSYGSNATNAGPSNTDGGYFFETPHSFGQYQIRVGVNGGNLFPVCAWEDGSADAPGLGPANTLVTRDDLNVTTFSVDRLTGNGYFAGKLTVAGVIDPTALILSDPALGTNLYIESANGVTAAVSPLTRGRLRYNNVATRWEESHNGSPWAPIGGGGGIPAGSPNGLVYYDPTGTTIVDDVNLTAFPLDPQGRPQIWDKRFSTRGTIFRQGSWEEDGDPTSIKAEGIVTYGSNAINGGPSGAAGGFFLESPHSFGQYQIIPGVNGGNLFPVCAWEDGSADAPGIGSANTFELRDDTNTTRFSVSRSTGDVFIAPPTVPATDGFLFMGNNGVLHGSASRVQLSSLVASGAQFRGNQYGANAGVPGISTFKSRGLTIGSLGGIIAGDVMGGWTAVGVAPDNVSIPLAATLQFRVPLNFVPAAQNWAPSELSLELVSVLGPINGRRLLFKVSSEGEVQSIFLQPGRPAATQAGYATYSTLGDAFPTIKVTSDAIGGLVEMGPGGATAPDTRVRRIAQSGGVPQIVADDNGFAAGAVNVIPAADGISKLGTRSVADNGNDPVSKRWGDRKSVV
jgi:hypothetical protein